MRRVALLSAALAANVLAGCATSSLTPTVETRQSIVSYDIQGLEYQGVAERIVATHREVMSSARIERTFAPDPLPVKSGWTTHSPVRAWRVWRAWAAVSS